MSKQTELSSGSVSNTVIELLNQGVILSGTPTTLINGNTRGGQSVLTNTSITDGLKEENDLITVSKIKEPINPLYIVLGAVAVYFLATKYIK